MMLAAQALRLGAVLVTHNIAEFVRFRLTWRIGKLRTAEQGRDDLNGVGVGVGVGRADRGRAESMQGCAAAMRRPAKSEPRSHCLGPFAGRRDERRSAESVD